MSRKLILSRKGFDSSPQGGRGPSPILPDGTLLSLPIPSSDSTKYTQLAHHRFGKYSEIIQQLGLKPGRKTCHLDPDLQKKHQKRKRGWRPSLGQSGAAQSHLARFGVGKGDLFLFFGWFRHTELSAGGGLRWSRSQRQDLHVLFGYLEVEDVVRPKVDRVPAWLGDHPHAMGRRSQVDHNAIYIASQKSQVVPGCTGSGVLRFHKKRVLTRPGKSRSWWNLPKSVFGKVEITYHKNAWKPEGFRCVGRGQEFVMPLTQPIQKWVGSKIVDEL